MFALSWEIFALGYRFTRTAVIQTSILVYEEQMVKCGNARTKPIDQRAGNDYDLKSSCMQTFHMRTNINLMDKPSSGKDI